MADDLILSRQRLLEPMDRIVEVFCGLLMVLTFTLTIDRTAARETVREMLLAALGCNVAWGIIDGAIHVMARFSNRRKGLMAIRTVRHANAPEDAYRTIADTLPPMVASVLVPADYEQLRQRLNDLPNSSLGTGFTKDDWSAGLGIFLLVFLSTLPVAAPFIFMSNVTLALRVSNFIAVTLLFLVGFLFGRATETNPWRSGLIALGVGSLLVAVAMVLGG